MSDLRFKEVAKSKGLELKNLSERAGISYPSFNKRMKNPTFDTLKEMASLFECNIHELITPPAGFKHLYTPAGEWLGIVPEHGNDTRPLYMEDNGSFTLIGSITPDKVKKP